MTEETFSELTFSEQVLAIGKAKQGVRGVSKSQILFMVHGDEILQALDEGLPKKWIWEALRKDGSCPTYPRFIEQLQRFLKERRPQTQPGKPTSEESIAKASPTPAAGQQTSAKPPTQPKGFEYHAPTPEDIKKLYEKDN